MNTGCNLLGSLSFRLKKSWGCCIIAGERLDQSCGYATYQIHAVRGPVNFPSTFVTTSVYGSAAISVPHTLFGRGQVSWSIEACWDHIMTSLRSQLPTAAFQLTRSTDFKIPWVLPLSQLERTGPPSLCLQSFPALLLAREPGEIHIHSLIWGSVY